tara:strand:- start:50 stop:523 length:474 start_codon:yes stop_codon:yes gene_type:complete
MKKLLLLMLVFVTACTSLNTDIETNSDLIEDINDKLTFTQIYYMDDYHLKRVPELLPKSVKVYDSNENLIGFQNDILYNLDEYTDNGTRITEFKVLVYEVEFTSPIKDLIYLKINENEYDRDDIEKLIDTKCLITGLVLFDDDEFKLLIQNIKKDYC